MGGASEELPRARCGSRWAWLVAPRDRLVGGGLGEAGPERQWAEPETPLGAWEDAAGLGAGGGSALGGRLFGPARSSASGAHYGMTKSRLWAPCPTPVSSLREQCI